MTQLNNIKVLKDFRKELRNNLTPAEAVLWKYLKGKQLEGRKFRRQHSVGYYILDFYCPAEKLAIELDGAHHYTSAGIAYDEERTIFLNSLGIKVIRFENKEVFEFTSEVIERIRNCFTTPTPSLERRGVENLLNLQLPRHKAPQLFNGSFCFR